jgi:hypothetical protein
VASVVHLAATLGLVCVAEGIETAEQANILEDLGCGLGQGYLWSPAVPLEDLKEVATVQTAPKRHPRVDSRLIDKGTRSCILHRHRDGISLDVIAAMLNGAESTTAARPTWSSSAVARVIARSAYPRVGGDEES